MVMELCESRYKEHFEPIIEEPTYNNAMDHIHLILDEEPSLLSATDSKLL